MGLKYNISFGTFEVVSIACRLVSFFLSAETKKKNVGHDDVWGIRCSVGGSPRFINSSGSYFDYYPRMFIKLRFSTS